MVQQQCARCGEEMSAVAWHSCDSDFPTWRSWALTQRDANGRAVYRVDDYGELSLATEGRG